MSSDVLISLRGVGKCYNLYTNPIDRLKQMIGNRLPLKWRKRYYTEHWAVRSIDLDIARGETIGILGSNGSGKSTLLQMICGILRPTSGSVLVKGRIAPLLQLGAGFNPEFTGRENVRFNAAILGLNEEDIEKRFDSIVEFADIGEMLERPVKLYSSGMYARLAFAVAINVDPDILIVDEALSVGDEGFQRKCFSRIEAIRNAGATILFVSHASSVVQQLCNRAVLLDHGEILQVGDPKAVIQNFQRLLFAPSTEAPDVRRRIKAGESLSAMSTPKTSSSSAGTDTSRTFFDSSLIPTSTLAYPIQGAVISNVSIRNDAGERLNILQRNENYWYEYDVLFHEEIACARFAMTVKTVTGLELGAQWSNPHGDEPFDIVPANARLRIKLPLSLPLAPGVYFGNAGVVGVRPDGQEAITLHRIVDAIMFRVLPVSRDRMSHFVDISGGLPSSVTRLDLTNS